MFCQMYKLNHQDYWDKLDNILFMFDIKVFFSMFFILFDDLLLKIKA